MKKIDLVASLLVVITLFTGVFIFNKILPESEQNVGGNQSNLLPSLTQSTTTVSTTRVRLLPANSGRQYARIELDPQNATSTVYLYLTNASTSVVALGGIPLNATTTSPFIIDDSNLYLGEVWAITQTGGPRVHVTTN